MINVAQKTSRVESGAELAKQVEIEKLRQKKAAITVQRYYRAYEG